MKRAKKWDVRVEPDIDLVSGRPIMRVKYRALGKRGRFESFVMVPPYPTDSASIFKVVDAYEAKRLESRQ